MRMPRRHNVLIRIEVKNVAASVTSHKLRLVSRAVLNHELTKSDKMQQLLRHHKDEYVLEAFDVIHSHLHFPDLLQGHADDDYFGGQEQGEQRRRDNALHEVALVDDGDLLGYPVRYYHKGEVHEPVNQMHQQECSDKYATCIVDPDHLNIRYVLIF